MAKSGASQTIEELQTRFDGLNKQKIKVETQREHALAQLEDLKSQANELYGSDDVDQLKSTLEELKTKNEKMRSEYQSSLNQIDQDLAEINEKFSEPDEE